MFCPIEGTGLPRGTVVKNPPASAGDTGDPGSIPGWGRCPGEGHDSPLQYSCLENTMDRGAWQAAVRRGAQSGLKRLGTQHKAGRELEKDVEKVCFSDETVVYVQDGSVERCRSEGMVGGAIPDPRGWTWA